MRLVGETVRERMVLFEGDVALTFGTADCVRMPSSSDLPVCLGDR